MEVHEREERDEEGYTPLEEIDFARIHAVFRDLVFFDDTFLNMQAMNIALTDQHLTHWEYDLLRELRKLERTPVDSAMTVSAWSQMWIFALYELLRTWRQRINDLLDHQKRGTLDGLIANIRNGMDGMNPAAIYRVNHAEQVRDDESFRLRMLDHRGRMNDVFRMTEAIRINLAKHEMPKRGHLVVRAPGYGRINPFCGAMDYEVAKSDVDFTTTNRRDIADAIRRVSLDNLKS